MIETISIILFILAVLFIAMLSPKSSDRNKKDSDSHEKKPRDE